MNKLRERRTDFKRLTGIFNLNERVGELKEANSESVWWWWWCAAFDVDDKFKNDEHEDEEVDEEAWARLLLRQGGVEEEGEIQGKLARRMCRNMSVPPFFTTQNEEIHPTAFLRLIWHKD